MREKGNGNGNGNGKGNGNGNGKGTQREGRKGARRGEEAVAPYGIKDER